LVVKVVAGEVEETPAAGDNRLRLLAHPERTGNKHCQAVLLRILPGHKFPKHKHPDSDDVIYILKGRVSFSVGEEKVELGPGELVVVPERVPHSAVNSTDEDVEALVFQAPVPKFEFLE
jgi:quercetin dioxygenase-like cupin family protein